ncbi:prepilin-type N-terminal cleavage/methylation domain-containing protein [Klebsiella variicola]|uniref:prepilin-type N-terminal cleavage/methylation domain-containing protein n=1 Tax=Klebsiella variicola TaxID=244366 RepID=UPI0010338607|nr:prepilin-type N-terminal cleavage/methylation domain-containing protein [Klebsiella variicola]
MSNALKHQRGFSLPETVLAMALMVLTVTALGGYQRGMAQGIVQLNQTRQLWRDAWRYSKLSAPPSPPSPARGQVSRMQTSTQRCVSITVTISMPVAKRVQMTRLHCPVSQ